jgi:hypothetical protein
MSPRRLRRQRRFRDLDQMDTHVGPGGLNRGAAGRGEACTRAISVGPAPQAPEIAGICGLADPRVLVEQVRSRSRGSQEIRSQKNALDLRMDVFQRRHVRPETGARAQRTVRMHHVVCVSEWRIIR